MKILTGILGASLALTLATPVFAQEEGLQVPETADLDLTSGDDMQEPGYLYFRQAEPIDTGADESFEPFQNSITSFTPRASVDSSPFGTSSVAVDRFMFQGFTPRYGDAQIDANTVLVDHAGVQHRRRQLRGRDHIHDHRRAAIGHDGPLHRHRRGP